jgi:hypothetical protein
MHGLLKVKCTNKKKLFPLPFLDSVLDLFVGHEMYSFMDGYSGYNQIKITKTDNEKTTFILEWGTYAYNIMLFGLCNAMTAFQKAITKAFMKYLNDFMQIFLDDFGVCGSKENHL